MACGSWGSCRAVRLGLVRGRPVAGFEEKPVGEHQGRCALALAIPPKERELALAGLVQPAPPKTDGFKPYQHAIVMSLGAQYVDFAQLVRMYGQSAEPDTRYSPAECIGARKVVIYGQPDMDRVSTSGVERQNLSTRMQTRRYTRLTNAFSKQWAKQHAALALWYAYYNFCRIHRSLRVTPAMEAGITSHIWTLKELLTA